MDGDCSHEIKIHLLIGRKVVTNLDSILKSRDLTLPTKVCIVKAMVFPVVIMDVSESESHSVVSDSLRPHGLYSPWKSPGQNTGMSSLSLLQGIFPTQGLNPGLPHRRQILYQLSHKGSPRDANSVPGLGRSPGEGYGNPLQYFCLGNLMNRGTWQARICGAAKSQTQLSNIY